MDHISFLRLSQSNVPSYLKNGQQGSCSWPRCAHKAVFGHIYCIFVNLSRVTSFRQMFYTFDVGFQPLTWPATLLRERTLTKAAHIRTLTIQDRGELWMGILILVLVIKVVHIRLPKCRHSGLWIWNGCTGLVTLPLRIGLVKTWNKS